MVGRLISDGLWRMWKGLVMPCLGICLKELRNITSTLITGSHCHGYYSKRALVTHTQAIINQVLVYFAHMRNGGTAIDLDGSMRQ
jgi:hypothetical protein